MKTQLLITASGEDRPGIVARITEVLVTHGANLEESRMALLGGDFAAIMMVAAPEDRVDSLCAALDDLTREGLSISSKRAHQLDRDRLKGYVPYELTLSGADHEGIVHRVAGFLRDRSINIQSMDSDVISAPVTGTPLFCMKAIMQVPPSISLAELKEELGYIGDEESVEIEVRIPAM